MTAVSVASQSAQSAGREPGRVRSFLLSLRPTWSRPAAYRAVRATLVMPALFALSSQVVGNLQMATYAAFGSFATLVLAAFTGSRLERLRAHLALAVGGTALIAVGTVISSNTALAAGISFLVVFCVLFAGILGPNALSGSTAVLLAFVLSAASPGTLAMVPWRLAGWWLASVAGTLAVLVLPSPPAPNPVRAAASKAAGALADELGLEPGGGDGASAADAATAALVRAAHAAPSRPSGLALSEAALADFAEVMQWTTEMVDDVRRQAAGLPQVEGVDRRLLEHSAKVLRQTADLLAGRGEGPEIAELEQLAAESSDGIVSFCGAAGSSSRAIRLAFDSRIIADGVRSAAADALIAERRVDTGRVAAERMRWQGLVAAPVTAGRPGVVVRLRRLLGGHAGLRSVWFLNSVRGAAAIALAVAVADLTKVQHGFWVVLGALSVLRTTAAATGMTALRAVLGTAVGFALGAALILGIGGSSTALWAVLPLAVLVAAYAPGTAPFAVGQAAFSVMILVLFNILAPVGWRVGVVRIEDVALGVGVSIVVGALFWPRGAASVVSRDLAAAYHLSGLYLVQATAWALGWRRTRPDAGGAAVEASTRLDDAVRALLAEGIAKQSAREALFRLANATLRVRLSAQSLASVPEAPAVDEAASQALMEDAVRLAGACDGLATGLGDSPETVAEELARLPARGPRVDLRGYPVWVREHLVHVHEGLAGLDEVAGELVAERRRRWWQ